MLYTREQIVEMVEKINWDPVGRYNIKFHEKVAHISDMLEDIQEYLLNEKGHPPSRFVKACAEEDWRYAEGIADTLNNEVLTKTSIFQDFVKIVRRESNINKLLK